MASAAAPATPWMTKAEAAQYIGRSTSTIDRWVDEGLGCYLVLGSVYFDRHEVDEFIRNHRRQGRRLRRR